MDQDDGRRRENATAIAKPSSGNLLYAVSRATVGDGLSEVRRLIEPHGAHPVARINARRAAAIDLANAAIAASRVGS